MTECNLTDFSITIQGKQAPYTATASYDGATASGTFSPSIDDPEWQNILFDLEQTMFTPNEKTLQRVGSRLFTALINADIRDLWVAARADLEHERVEGIRLRLDLQPASVSALPWEALYDADRNLAFAAGSRLSLVRVATLYRHLGRARRLRVSLPLRVLIVAPDDPGAQLDSMREIANTKQVLQTLGSDLVKVETMTGRFGITDLRRRLASAKPAILHFIGHGEPDGLMLWRHDKAVLVSSSSWRAALERAASVKLVLLNACLAAQSVSPNLFTGVSMQMLQAGLPAVIGMQTPIRDDAAIDFAHFLYEELISGPCAGSIDQAISSARSALYAVDPGDFSYGVPILWLNSKDGCIFIPESNGNGHQNAVELSQQEIPHLDLTAEQTWLDLMLQETACDQLPAAYLFLRTKWRNLLEEMANLLTQIEALMAQQDQALLTQKQTEYRRYKAAALRVRRLINEAIR